MRQNIIFVMSLSGTMVYLLYIFTYYIARKYFPTRWRYRILKISLVCFLLPLPYFKPIIKKTLEAIAPFFKSEVVLDDIRMLNELNLILKNYDSFMLSEGARRIWITAFCIGVISLTIIFTQLHKYIKAKHICLNHGVNSPPDFLLERLEAAKTTMEIRTSVKLVLSEFIRQPIVIGVFHPVIVIPLLNDDQFTQQEWDYVIKHELTHIKSKDLLIKFAGLLVMAIHWFNPFCYFLFREISSVSEICCDDYVMGNKDTNEKKRYCHFIVSLASENELAVSGLFSVGLADNNLRTIRRRVLEMKALKKTGKKVLSYLLCGVICVMSGLTVFAYEAPLIIETKNGENIVFDENNTFLAFIGSEVEFEKMPYDCFFTDYNGNIFETSEIDVNPKAGCIHDFTDGTFVQHTAKGDGGCSVTYYSAQRCIYCDYLIINAKENTVSYENCPH